MLLIVSVSQSAYAYYETSDLGNVIETDGEVFLKDTSKEYVEKGRVKRGIYKLDNMVYNADSGGAYNIMRLYAQEKNTSIDMMCKGLSNPNKICICVTRS